MEDKFEIVYEQPYGNRSFSLTVVRDKTTGVLYLISNHGYGITPMLDAQGNPLRQFPDENYSIEI